MTSRTYSTRGPMRDPNVENHYVYRLYTKSGVLMYVGCSKQPPVRIKQHRFDGGRAAMVKRIAEVRIEGPYTYQHARQVEYDAIHTENPTESAQTPAAVAKRTKELRASRRRIAARTARQAVAA